MKITCLRLLYGDSSCLLRQLHLPSVFPLSCTCHGLITYPYSQIFFSIIMFHSEFFPSLWLTLDKNWMPAFPQIWDSAVDLKASRDPFHSHAKTKAGCQLWMPSKPGWAVQITSTACLEIPRLHMYMLDCASLTQSSLMWNYSQWLDDPTLNWRCHKILSATTLSWLSTKGRDISLTSAP